MFALLLLGLSLSACPPPPGAAKGTVEVAGQTAFGFHDQGIGMGRWAAWNQDWWLQFQTDCRVVGLRNDGGAGSLSSVAYFAVQPGQPGPSAVEQQALLTFAGAHVVDTNDAAWRLSQLPALAPSPDSIHWATDDGLPAIRCRDQGSTPVAKAQASFEKPRDVWVYQPRNGAVLEQDHWANHCPCFQRFQGNALRERGIDVRLPGGQRFFGLHTGYRNDSHVFGLQNMKTQGVRWLASHAGGARILGAQGHRVWLTTSDLSMDMKPPMLTVIDTQKLISHTCVVLGGLVNKLEPDADGLNVEFVRDDGSISHHRFTWAAMERERQAASGERRRWQLPNVLGIEKIPE